MNDRSDQWAGTVPETICCRTGSSLKPEKRGALDIVIPGLIPAGSMATPNFAVVIEKA
jgi:hypothetical protein